MPYLLQASVVIIILLLNIISAEQKVKIKKLPRIRPVYIYAKTISIYLLQEICIKVYTYILISLELLVSKRFYKTLTNPTFYIYISLVVINKVHLIANQGGLFWNLYIQLQKVQLLLGRKPQCYGRFKYNVTTTQRGVGGSQLVNIGKVQNRSSGTI